MKTSKKYFGYINILRRCMMVNREEVRTQIPTLIIKSSEAKA